MKILFYTMNKKQLLLLNHVNCSDIFHTIAHVKQKNHKYFLREKNVVFLFLKIFFIITLPSVLFTQNKICKLRNHKLSQQK